MNQSFAQAFEQIRSAIPNNVEAVVIYRRKQFYDPSGHWTESTITECEVSFAFHTSAKTAFHFFERAERLAKAKPGHQGGDCVAAVIFGRCTRLKVYQRSLPRSSTRLDARRPKGLYGNVRRATSRAVTGIDSDIKINRRLFDLADAFAQLKGAKTITGADPAALSMAA